MVHFLSYLCGMVSVIENCQYQCTCRVSCIASTYCGVTRKHVDFQNRHIEMHIFTRGIFSQQNDMFKKFRAQGKNTANPRLGSQIYGF